MIAEKIKLRISNFVSIIIDHDAQLWGFVKNDDTSNKNGFLNKLIPNMLAIRKERREEIKRILQDDYKRHDAEQVYQCVNSVIDEVYFKDEELNELSIDIWIRPTKDSLIAFDEIESEELATTLMDMTSYIRGLLNEYARLPQYKRQDIIFMEEENIINEASSAGQILCFNYDKERYKVFAYWHIYQYALEQRSYLVAFDIERNEISSFFIEKIINPYLLKKKYIPTQRLLDILKDYCENEELDEYAVVQVKEVKDEK